MGYKYFRRDHSAPTNLCLHLVSLGWQLLGNFGLLAAVLSWAAKRVGVQGAKVHFGLLAAVLSWPLSALSAICWGGVLLASPAPLVVSLASAASIGGAYWVAPLLAPRELELGAMTLFLTVQVLSKLAFPQSSMRQAESTTVPSSKLASQDVAGGTLHTCKLFGLAPGVPLRRRALASSAKGTQITCVASTKVQALMQKGDRARLGSLATTWRLEA